MDSISENEEGAGEQRRGFSKCVLRTGAAVLRTFRGGMRRSASLGKSAKAMTRASEEPTCVQISDGLAEFANQHTADPSGTLDESAERMMLINRALRHPTFSPIDMLGD
jgi:hypothetical protein